MFNLDIFEFNDSKKKEKEKKQFLIEIINEITLSLLDYLYLSVLINDIFTAKKNAIYI